MKDGRKVVGFAVQAVRVVTDVRCQTGSVISSVDVCFAPMSGRRQDALACPKSANMRHWRHAVRPQFKKNEATN
jgi:hypothetical protein